MSGEDVVIANGQTASGAFDFSGKTKLAIQFPAAMTGATISFTASNKSDGTFAAVWHNGGTPAAIDVAKQNGAVVGLVGDDMEALAPCKWLKIVSASAEGAERSFIVYME